uniref:Uncharacterized protein n=1 Tax=uncultured marine virus TaxID=186617 RepID=A0A0F7L645_9VIRU|nr:hypothetical protein [uncultured marine virus]
MHELLEFLHGKKASIVAIVSLTLNFLVLKGFMDMDTAMFVSSVVGVFAFGADYQTKKLLGTNRK